MTNSKDQAGKREERERALEMARRMVKHCWPAYYDTQEPGVYEQIADAILEARAEEADYAASLYDCNCEEFWRQYPMRGGHGPNCAIEDKEQFQDRAKELRSQKSHGGPEGR